MFVQTCQKGEELICTSQAETYPQLHRLTIQNSGPYLIICKKSAGVVHVWKSTIHNLHFPAHFWLEIWLQQIPQILEICNNM
jgi:hypothetical protein